LAQPDIASASEDLFASVFTNLMPRAGSTNHDPAQLALPPALGGTLTGAAALVAAGPAVNAEPVVATSPGAQGGGLYLTALGFYAGLPAVPKAEDAGRAGSPLSPREQTAAVHALFNAFDLSTTTVSPFPSNRFTIADHTQNTGLQVSLPIPDPTTHLSDYQDIQVINTLDGFNIQPRLSIPFDGLIDVNSVKSGPIDVTSVASHDVFLINLGDTVDHREHGDHLVGINQIVWDPATTTLFAESDQLLDQHTRYALIVTDGVLDANEQQVQASEAFKHFRHDLNFGQTKDPALKEYRKDLIDAEAAAAQVGVPESDIVTASVFTTQSVTATLEKIRDQIDSLPLPAANFDIGLNGEHTVYNLSQVTKIEQRQEQVVGSLTKAAPVILPLLNVIPGAVDRVAFGKYSSLDFEVHPGEYIPAVGTRTGTPAVQGYKDIYFDLFLPFGTRPADGWPVAIYNHGGGGNKEGQFGVAAFAAEMAAHGIATIGINVVGHGFGSKGTLTVTKNVGGNVTTETLPAGGRGIDQNGDGIIGSSEGFEAAAPQGII
jgi:hypothetical protein